MENIKSDQELEEFIIAIVRNEMLKLTNEEVQSKLTEFIHISMKIVEDYNKSYKQLSGEAKQSIVVNVMKAILSIETPILPVNILEGFIISTISAFISISKNADEIQTIAKKSGKTVNCLVKCMLCCCK